MLVVSSIHLVVLVRAHALGSLVVNHHFLTLETTHPGIRLVNVLLVLSTRCKVELLSPLSCSWVSSTTILSLLLLLVLDSGRVGAVLVVHVALDTG